MMGEREEPGKVHVPSKMSEDGILGTWVQLSLFPLISN